MFSLVSRKILAMRKIVLYSVTSMKNVLSPNWSSFIQNQSNFLLSSYKFIYSVKTTKFCDIFTLLLTVCTLVKSKVKISQNFMPFSEYMNFTINSLIYEWFLMSIFFDFQTLCKSAAPQLRTSTPATSVTSSSSTRSLWSSLPSNWWAKLEKTRQKL